MILHLPNQSHKRVESIEEIPKLKLYNVVNELSGCQEVNVGASPTFHEVTILQEFQYGSNVFQTTTNKHRVMV